MNANVSIIVLTLNEEANIENCLKNVYKWSDDVHVVDSFSEDDTVKCAMKYTDKIHHVKEGHWADIRNWSLKNLPLKYDWILFLDADEKLTNSLKEEISKILNQPTDLNGFYIRRRFIFMGKWLKHGGLYPKVLRLFKKANTEYILNGDVEYAKVQGCVGLLKNDMIHEDKKSISRWIEKHNKISDRAAKQYLTKSTILLDYQEKGIEIEGGRNTRIKYTLWEKIPLVIRPSVTFLYQYVLNFGFLDGLEGLIYHLLQAFWYRLLIYCKVRESHVQLCKVQKNAL